MSRVEELLHAFIAAFRAAGDADPRPYLRELTGTDRAELRALIDHFLAIEPPPAFDPAAFAAFRADPERAALVERVLDERSLVELRQAASLTKADVGARLAAELELAGQESAAKGAYHRIETGQVEPERVKAPVWALLARYYDASIEQLRSATRAAFDARPTGPSTVFARSDATASAPSPKPAPGDEAVRRAFFED